MMQDLGKGKVVQGFFLLFFFGDRRQPNSRSLISCFPGSTWNFCVLEKTITAVVGPDPILEDLLHCGGSDSSLQFQIENEKFILYLSTKEGHAHDDDSNPVEDIHEHNVAVKMKKKTMFAFAAGCCLPLSARCTALLLICRPDCVHGGVSHSNIV